MGQSTYDLQSFLQHAAMLLKFTTLEELRDELAEDEVPESDRKDEDPELKEMAWVQYHDIVNSDAEGLLAYLDGRMREAAMDRDWESIAYYSMTFERVRELATP